MILTILLLYLFLGVFIAALRTEREDDLVTPLVCIVAWPVEILLIVIQFVYIHTSEDVDD